MDALHRSLLYSTVQGRTNQCGNVHHDILLKAHCSAELMAQVSIVIDGKT
jgi:hypothetical protein